jgi:hypothetical protein
VIAIQNFRDTGGSAMFDRHQVSRVNWEIIKQQIDLGASFSLSGGAI